MSRRFFFALIILAAATLLTVGLSGCFADPEGTAEPAASATATVPAAPTGTSPPTATEPPVVDPTVEPTPIHTDTTPTATPTPPPTATPSVTATPEPESWWTVAQSTWNDTFEVMLQVFGPTRLTTQTELRIRTVLRNVSDSDASYIKWSESDPIVATWMARPTPPTQPGVRPAVRLITLRAADDPTQSADSFPAIKTESLAADDVREREVSWDLTVRGESEGGRVAAPDGEYTLRAEFYPKGGNEFPGMPDILLEYRIILERGVDG